MARLAIKITVGTTHVDKAGNPTGQFGGQRNSAIAGAGLDPATVVADAVTVAADVATLVADGVTPTQAHVTTLNTDWGALNTAITALNAASAGDLTVSFDTSKITTVSQLARAFDLALSIMRGAGTLTP